MGLTKNISRILTILISPFLKIKKCKSECCECECTTQSEPETPIEKYNNDEDNIKVVNV